MLSELQKTKIIKSIYFALLGRDTESDGLMNWLRFWDEGMTLERIVEQIASSDECINYEKTESTEELREAIKVYCNKHLSVFNLDPITVVDVGAQRIGNEKHIYEDLFDLNIPIKVICFEPLSEHHERVLSKTKNVDYVVKSDFIGDGSAQIFHINKPDSTSSLLPLNKENVKKLVGLDNLETIHTEQACTVTLDAALKEEKNIDFLKLDIQGYELQALKAGTDILKKCSIIQCEVEFTEIYRHQYLFSDIEIFLRKHGFELLDLCHPCRYPVKNAYSLQSKDVLGWAEAIFIKKPSDINDLRAYLIKITILCFVYKKVSLAGSLFSKIDLME